MLGSLILYLKGTRIVMFQLSGVHYKVTSKVMIRITRYFDDL